MFTLNTKQVRALAKQVTNVSAQYTEKTQKKTNPTSKRRSVVFCFNNAQDANALAQFLRINTLNTVTRTGTLADMWRRTGGIEYVRIIADIA